MVAQKPFFFKFPSFMSTLSNRSLFDRGRLLFIAKMLVASYFAFYPTTNPQIDFDSVDCCANTSSRFYFDLLVLFRGHSPTKSLLRPPDDLFKDFFTTFLRIFCFLTVISLSVGEIQLPLYAYLYACFFGGRRRLICPRRLIKCSLAIVL